MKKNLLLLLVLLGTTQLFAQSFFSNHKIKHLYSYTPIYENKQTRSANERCIKIEYHYDTSTITPNPALLQNKNVITFSGNRKSKPVIFNNLLVIDMLNDFDKNVGIFGYSSSFIDSNITLVNYDASDRKIYEANVIFNGLGFDTTYYSLFRYTSTNRIADSVTRYNNINIPATIANITKNYIASNNVDSTLMFSFNGTSLVLDATEYYKYNTAGFLTESKSLSTYMGFTNGDMTQYRYNAINLLDSIIEFNYNGGNFIAISKSKFYYNSGFTNGYYHSYNNTNVKKSGVKFSLNTDKKITQAILYNFNTNIDSTFIEMQDFVINNNGNLVSFVNKVYKDAFSLVTFTQDSTIYTYEQFTPLSINNNTTKVITSLSCTPNPVSNAANIFYSSTTNAPMQIVVTDMLGKQIYSTKLKSVNGNSYISIPMQDLQTGIYNCAILVNNVLQQCIKINKL